MVNDDVKIKMKNDFSDIINKLMIHVFAIYL